MGRKIKRVTSEGKNFAKLSFPAPVRASLHTLLVIFNLLLSSTETDARSQHHDLAKNHLMGGKGGKVVKGVKLAMGYTRGGKAVVEVVGYRAFLLSIAPFLILFPSLP